MATLAILQDDKNNNGNDKNEIKVFEKYLSSFLQQKMFEGKFSTEKSSQYSLVRCKYPTGNISMTKSYIQRDFEKHQHTNSGYHGGYIQNSNQFKTS